MKFQKDMNTLTLSVSELVAIAYPAGDIHAGGYGVPIVSASMRAKFLETLSENQDFVSDFSVSAEIASVHSDDDVFTADTPEYVFSLSDRLDGIRRREGGTSTLYLLLPSGGYDGGGRFRARSLAQLRAAAALYCISFGEREVELSYATAHRDGSRLLFENQRVSDSELLASLHQYLLAASPTTDLLVKHRALSVPRAGDVSFPYPALRDGQEELIRTAYRALRQGKRLFLQAPTGIGKTVSTLYPAVRALGNGYIDKIFYLTAKASTGREAFAAAGKLFRAGAKLRTCVISAKEEVCLCDKKGTGGDFCNPFDCPYADGYYERALSAVLSLLLKQNGYTRTLITETARKYGVCPYELSLDLSEKCDIIICDYNYVFDPKVYLRRYFGEERSFDGKYAFLIDEGHNLADRAREMYSTSLFWSEIQSLDKRLTEAEVLLKKVTEHLLGGFEELKNLCSDTLTKARDGSETGFFMSREAPQFWDVVLEKAASGLKEYLRTARCSPFFGEASELFRKIRTYRLLRGYSDDRFLSMVRVRNGDIEVRLFCLDPSEVLDECLSRARAAIVFSATLTPLDYFTDLLGGGKSAETLSLPSPFPRENLCVAVADAVSTRFENRSASIRGLVSLIAATVSRKVGNYIVYFPSYAYLEETAKAFCARYPKVRLVLQRRGMSHAERDTFLDSFRDDGKLRVGFCVLGGSFSEGVDLPGGRLIGTVIVGVGLPGLSEEGNILRDYYENKCERGYDYAYTFPGMNRVLQAAGRVIRTDSDRGVVVLIDDRYALPAYRTLFPPHWEGLQYAGNSASLAEILRRFWEKSP